MRKRLKILEKELACRRSRSPSGSKTPHRSRSFNSPSHVRRMRDQEGRDRSPSSLSQLSGTSQRTASNSNQRRRSVSGERGGRHRQTDPHIQCRDVDRTHQGSTVQLPDRSPGGSATNSQESIGSDVEDGISILNEENLADDLDMFLGSEPDSNNDLGKKIHSTLAERWSQILLQGLQKDSETELTSKYKVPVNCPSLIPPDINPEMLSILSSSQTGRDKYYHQMQGQLGKGLTALSASITYLQDHCVSIPTDIRNQLLPSLCDSGRLFCNLFNSITKSRRALILPLLNKNVKDVIENTPPSDKFIFGTDLNEKIKEVKNVETTAKELKQKFKPQSIVRHKPERGGGGGRGVQRPREQPKNGPLNQYRPIRQPREARFSRRNPSNNYKQKAYQRRH